MWETHLSSSPTPTNNWTLDGAGCSILLLIYTNLHLNSKKSSALPDSQTDYRLNIWPKKIATIVRRRLCSLENRWQLKKNVFLVLKFSQNICWVDAVVFMYVVTSITLWALLFQANPRPTLRGNRRSLFLLEDQTPSQTLITFLLCDVWVLFHLHFPSLLSRQQRRINTVWSRHQPPVLSLSCPHQLPRHGLATDGQYSHHEDQRLLFQI